MKFLVVLACALAFVAAEKEKPVVLCGRQLANARVLICYGAEYIMKRASPENLLDDDKWLGEWIWRGRQGAISADWTRYKRDGLADECCLRPCTTEVILKYC
ncbi:insulin-related peptide 2 [Leptidea sinapis]|nr:insulin-related peptide 2 [Leptidea sinapis]